MRGEAQDFCATFADAQTGEVGQLVSVEYPEERVCFIVCIFFLWLVDLPSVFL